MSSYSRVSDVICPRQTRVGDVVARDDCSARAMASLLRHRTLMGGLILRCLVPAWRSIDRQPSRRPVTALALYEYSGRISEKGHRSRNVLVAASRDGVLLYYLEDALCSAQVPPYDGGTDEVVTPEPLQLAMAPQAEIEHVAFDDTGLLVAMCQGHFVDILQVSAAKGLAATSDSAGRFPRDDEERPPEPLMRLGDQGSIIIASCFLPAQPHIC